MKIQFNMAPIKKKTDDYHILKMFETIRLNLRRYSGLAFVDTLLYEVLLQKDYNYKGK